MVGEMRDALRTIADRFDSNFDLLGPNDTVASFAGSRLPSIIQSLVLQPKPS